MPLGPLAQYSDVIVKNCWIIDLLVPLDCGKVYQATCSVCIKAVFYVALIVGIGACGF